MQTIFLGVLLSICLEASAQSKNFTFVILNKKLDAAQLPKEEIDKIMEGHMANINRLAQEKKLIAAGPFDGGGGIFILNTTSIDQARSWLSTDPGVKANRWDVEVFSYTPRIGAACLVNEPYEMVTYQFIRYKPDVSKAIGNNVESFNKHDAYLKELAQQGNIVAEGYFGEQQGGILIMKSELPKETIEDDPAVEEGLLELDLKKLWIAKGAFCEK